MLQNHQVHMGHGAVAQRQNPLLFFMGIEIRCEISEENYYL